jgi:hypothetical protein
VDGAGLAKLMASEKREYTFAQTFPTGTHAMWLYYWLAANGINPMKDAKVITVPPPQMVANMRVGNMDGFCVGEPWNHRAIIDGIGVTAATTQDIWKDHPEKVLGTTATSSRSTPTRPRRDRRHHRSRQVDRRGPANKNKMAETIADKSYVNTSVDAINQRILGRYQNGMGKTWDDPNHMKFFNDGAVNFPYLSDGMWFLTQHKRWGLLKDHPDYLAVAKQINQIDLYKQAASCRQGARAQGRDAHQQADGRRGLGRQRPEEIRRFVQGQGLKALIQEKHHGQRRLPRALRGPRLTAPASSPQAHNALKLIAEKHHSTPGTMQKMLENSDESPGRPGPGVDWRGLARDFWRWCCRRCWAWAC